LLLLNEQLVAAFSNIDFLLGFIPKDSNSRLARKVMGLVWCGDDPLAA